MADFHILRLHAGGDGAARSVAFVLRARVSAGMLSRTRVDCLESRTERAAHKSLARARIRKTHLFDAPLLLLLLLLL